MHSLTCLIRAAAGGRGGDMTTLKDISSELGLSVATVSRALNGFPEVSARTRTLVEETARRMNYRPNRAAQMLVTGRSGMIGMIVPQPRDNPGDRSFVEIVLGLSQRLADRDIDLVFQMAIGSDPVAPYRRLVDKDTMDAFILAAPLLSDPRVNFLRERGVPFVLHGTTGQGAANYPFFDLDNQAVSADAVTHLTGLDHARIALLNGEEYFAFAEARRAGFEGAMAKAGLPMPKAFVIGQQGGEDYGYSAAFAALSGQYGPRPTAFVCASTLIAAGVYRAAAEAGLSVPEDVSVIAHDDAIPEIRAAKFEPALTVTHAPLRDACEPLANAVIGLLGGAPLAELQTVAAAELIIRNSTAAAPDKEKAPWI